MMDIDALVRAIERHRSPVPFNLTIWSAREVADFLKCSPRHVTERLSNRPDFPAPRRMPSARGKGSLRWKATEVVDWFNKL